MPLLISLGINAMPKIAPVPCETCPRNIERVVVIRNSGLFLSETGAVHYGYTDASRRSINMGWVGPEDLEDNFQPLADAVRACEGPEQTSISKPGILGKIGLRHEVATCPALSPKMTQLTIDKIDQITNI